MPSHAIISLKPGTGTMTSYNALHSLRMSIDAIPARLRPTYKVGIGSLSWHSASPISWHLQLFPLYFTLFLYSFLKTA